MALTGDFHRLAELRKRIAVIASRGAMRELAFRMSNEVQRQIITGARAKRDPYGHAWAPRKDKRGTWPLLDKSGRGLNSFRSKGIPRGVRVTALGYMGFAQSGTRYAVARMLVPDPQIGLGPIWGGAINRVAAELGRELLGAR